MTGRVTIQLDRVEVGTVLVRDILDPHGQILIRSGQSLSERHLKALKAWGITEIEILPGGEIETRFSDTDAAAELRAMLDARFEISNRGHPAIERLYRLCLSWTCAQLHSVDSSG